MKRTVTSVSIGENKRRWRVVLIMEHKSPLEALQEIVEQPKLIECGPSMFQKMSMRHNGQDWILELEAVSDSV